MTLAPLTAASFVSLTSLSNPLGAFDVGDESTPSVGDVDGDGDLDMVAGNLAGELRLSLNIGSATSPAFTAANVIQNDVDSSTTSDRAAPAQADLNGDGVTEIVVGTAAGSVKYYRNVGGVYLEQTGANNPFGSITHVRGAPAFGDLDNDGDLDLVMGAVDGQFYFYRNAGLVFTLQTGTSDPFQITPGVRIDIGASSTPQLVDADGDGDFDIVAGNSAGSQDYLLNTGTAAAPVFTRQTGVSNPFPSVPPTPTTPQQFPTAAAPAFADLDSDGDKDIVLGNSLGFFNFFRNESAGIPVTVNLTLQNDPPELSGVARSVTFLKSVAPRRLDPRVTFSNPETDLVGGTLTVTGLLPQDVVSIRNVPGDIGFDGTTVTSGGNPFGTASGGAGSTFTVTFSGSPNSVIVDNLLQNLTFASPSTAPPSGRTLTITVRDAAGNPTVSTQGLVEVKGTQNPFNGIDIGNRSHPVLEDLDNSGDLDLVLGVGNGSVAYFRKDAGGFTPVTGGANPFSVVTSNQGGDDIAAPAFADLDGDGDRDLIVGQTNGFMRVFRRDGTAAAPVFTPLTGSANPFNGIDFGAQVKPEFADIDADGDLDLLLGLTPGTGSSATPARRLQPSSPRWPAPATPSTALRRVSGPIRCCTTSTATAISTCCTRWIALPTPSSTIVTTAARRTPCSSVKRALRTPSKVSSLRREPA